MPNDSSEINLLIGTDCISEGQNLQDAHIVVNYDLPWAIIRLIQRVGRVDRVGGDDASDPPGHARYRQKTHYTDASANGTSPRSATITVAGHPIEILQVQNRMVKVVRILPKAPPQAQAA